MVQNIGKICKLKKINYAKEYNYVLETDIAGFYENIGIERLMSVFRQEIDDSDLYESLWDFLKPVSEPRKRGLPQGYGPSDILAELYLDGIDRRLANHELQHIRYNDDFFVFTNSKDKAIEAQNWLDREFRRRGLNIKSGKTHIRPSDDAISSYLEPEQKFHRLKKELHEDTTASDSTDKSLKMVGSGNSGTETGFTIELARELVSDFSDPYGSSPSDDPYVSDGGETSGELEDVEINREVLLQAYGEFIEDVDFHNLETHIFRFIIRRMGINDLSEGIDYCIRYICEGAPDVRRIIYNYFNELSNPKPVVEQLCNHVAAGNLRYPFHEFVVIRWIHELDIGTDTVLHAARSLLESDRGLPETRDFAVSIIGNHGDYSDLEYLEYIYSEELRVQSKAVIAYAIRDIEPNHRNKIYERMDSEQYLVSLAIQTAKEDSS